MRGLERAFYQRMGLTNEQIDYFEKLRELAKDTHEVWIENMHDPYDGSFKPFIVSSPKKSSLQNNSGK